MERSILITATENEETNEGSLKVEWDPEMKDIEALSYVQIALEVVRSKLIQSSQAKRANSKIIRPNFPGPAGRG